ncbi:MAG: hypothetical protein ACFFAN_18910 [Promethearchaeota archaeon]
MDESLKKKAQAIINENIKNLELISYFKNSTIKTPVFLSVIQRKYTEIRPLLKKGLVKDLKPVKSYEFFLDKLENFFYENYQEKIDDLKSEIWRRKRKKEEIIQVTESMEPKEGSNDYDQKLQECLVYARKAIEDLDLMEIEKEKFNFKVGDLQERMKKDALYKFLLFVRNDKEIIYNKRTEDNEGKIRKKILTYLEKCNQGKGYEFFKELKKNGFFKEYSPAKNYYISELGLCVDNKLKEIKWTKEVEDYEKNEKEIAQEKEFNNLLKKMKL